MEMNLHLPAGYASLSEEEMTYTQGGGTFEIMGTVATVIGACFMGASYLWGVNQTKSWLKKNGTGGNLFTILGKGTDALVADMSKSFGNAVRDVVATGTMAVLWPLTLVLVVLG